MGEAVFTLLGVVVGSLLTWGLAEISTLRRERREETERRLSLTMMIRLEIEQNLTLLGGYQRATEVIDVEPDEYNPDDELYYHAERVVRLPLPPFSRLLWESQAIALTSALSKEQIAAALTHYNRLETLAALRAALVAAHSEQRTEVTAASDIAGDISPRRRAQLQAPFGRNAPQFWQECDRIILELLADGNPLAPA